MITFDFSKSGIAEKELATLEPACVRARQQLEEDQKRGVIGWMADTAPIKKMAAQFKGQFENLLVLGIGGSSHGLKCLAAALVPGRERQKLFVVENPDPLVAEPLLETLDFSKTLLVVISKSGETIETLTLLDFFRLSLRAQRSNPHIIAITEYNNGTLHRMAKEEKWATLEIPKNLGGRFSVFSAVGLFPLALLGVDIDQFTPSPPVGEGWGEGFLKNAAIHF
ncbi:MAG: hypothetical protein U1D33_03455, partial [bacterium]|nr:hypothetical protein [bacterium]